MVLSSLIAACLEVIDRSDDLVDGYGVTDDFCDIFDGSVGKRCLIQGVLVDTAGIDALHFCFERGEGEAVFDLLPFHDSSGTMGCRAVPSGISKSDSEKDSVTHIDGDNHLFIGFRRNRSLTKHGGTKGGYGFLGSIHVVVNTFVGIHDLPLHSLYQFVFPALDLRKGHSATDVDAYEIWNDFFSNRLNNQGFCDSMEKICGILLVLHTGRKNMRKSLSGKELGMGFSQRKALP